VKFIDGPGSIWRDMFVIGNYAYVGTEGGGGIQIVDISDPTDPTLVNTYTTTVDASHNVFGDPSRNLLFVVGGSELPNGGVNILDVTDPVNPVEIAVWDNQYVHDMSIEGTRAYVSLINQGRFRILDLTDPTAPANLGSFFTEPNDHASWPVGDGVHVLVTQESTGGHLRSLNVSNPNAITLADDFNPFPGASAHNVHVQGDQAFISWYARGTRVIDVTDPTDLVEIAYFDTYPDSNTGGVGPGNWGVYPHLPSGTIASNDGTYGLFLLRYDADAGLLNGVVSSSAGGAINGATVHFVDLNNTSVTGATGAYQFSSSPGTGLELQFSAFGHQPQAVMVNLAADGTTTTNVTLTKLPSGGLSGTIVDANTLVPIQQVAVVLDGTPLATTTNVAGNFTFADVPADSYTLSVQRYGYAPQTRSIVVSSGVVADEDFDLEPGTTYVDFSNPVGWTVEDGGASTGIWEFGDPNPTSSGGQPVQTGDDHTLAPETQCAVTGNGGGGGIGDDDVDNGATILVSPTYDLSSMTAPHAFYYRWYATTQSGDDWVVEATGNGGADWVELERTRNNENFWKAVDVDLTGLLPSYSAVQFRFIAEDLPAGEIIEAALDDFTLYDGGAGSVDAVVLPTRSVRLDLAQSRPNPFIDETSIRFSLPADGHAVLSVFDVRGARVATLVDAALEAGTHDASWNGRNSAGGEAASGVYFYKLQTKHEIRTKRLVKLH
jgi:choice-of-anchor B domain-containing protein